MPSADFITEMDKKIGSRPIDKVEIVLDTAGTVNITSWLKDISDVDLKRQEGGQTGLDLAISDLTLVFDNTTNYFSERQQYQSDGVTAALFWADIQAGNTYHNRLIKLYTGFTLPDGTTEYQIEATMKIVELECVQEDSECTIKCEDILKDLLDTNINEVTDAMTPVAGANTGDGVITGLAQLPFAAVDETWAITILADVTQFSVVGSVSGAQADGTVDSEYSNAYIRFTVQSGAVAFVQNDSWTFDVLKLPEFTAMNPLKIAWSLLTGYNYDTAVQEDWYARTLQLDATKTTANTDIDWTLFSTAVGNVQFTLTGYVPFDMNLATIIAHLIFLTGGSIYGTGDGKIGVTVFYPQIGGTDLREFSESKKITRLKYKSNLLDVYNKVTTYFHERTDWNWSDEEQDLSGTYTIENTDSQTKYQVEPALEIFSLWIADSETAKSITDKYLDRFNKPLLQPEFRTRLDALTLNPGDALELTESKANFDNAVFEITRLRKRLADKEIIINCRESDFLTVNWAFVGSTADESDTDYPYPIPGNYNDAVTEGILASGRYYTDYAYCSTSNAGEIVAPDPQYYCFG